jgi:hypothetical protein
MKMSDLSNRAILHHILDGGDDLPDVTGDFHMTVDGVPVCLVDLALVGDENSKCEYTSLNEAFSDCLNLQEVFPAAMVGVFLGRCPYRCMKEAA